jgi:glycosyltransferase involved in cell wall biosynthesis
MSRAWSGGKVSIDISSAMLGGVAHKTTGPNREGQSVPNTQSKEPLVTIGMPVYNSERYVRQSLDALLAQTYTDFTFVISDNASTDRTGEICREYARKDPRVHYFRNERNIGLSANFNRVLQLTNSKYLKWSTSNDLVAPDMLADAVAVMEADPSIILCYPKTILVDENGHETGRYDDRLQLMDEDPVSRYLTLLTNLRLCHQHQGLIRTDVLRRTSLLSQHTDSDVNLLAELSLYGKFFEVPKYQFSRRFHPDASSSSRSSQHQARHYYSSQVGRLSLPSYRFHLTFFKGVLRSPLTIRQKFRLIRVLLKRMYWDADLLKEPFEELRAILKR